MALTRRIHRGGKPTKGKKGKGHCTKGGKKTMRKGGKSLLVPATFLTALLAFGKKKKKTQKRKSKGGDGQLCDSLITGHCTQLWPRF